jgi:hypothetical protein
MKKILVVLAGLTFFYAAAAQSNSATDFEKYMNKKVKTKMNNASSSLSVQKMNASKVTARESIKPNYYILPNGNAVYALSQDHMPCVVPAPQNYSMSVAGTKQLLEKKAGKIPNLSTN